MDKNQGNEMQLRGVSAEDFVRALNENGIEFLYYTQNESGADTHTVSGDAIFGILLARLTQ